MIKKTKKTKSLALILMLVMILTTVPMMAFATDTWDSVTVDGLTVSVSSGTEALEINTTSSKSNFDIDSTDSDYPFSFSMILSHGDYTGTPTVSNGGTFTVYDQTATEDYCLVTLPENTTSIVTIVTAANSKTLTFNCDEPTGGSAGSGTGVYSFLPAPGQFVNEGIDSGGWGDIYQSGGTALKTLKDAHSATGVSLGAYGGSIVFDFGANGIDNTSTNKYGVDFIVYGNAFTNWAEPGCIQVAQADANGEPDTWYDIAGSRHYMSGTDWNCKYVYANPTPSDNTSGTSTCVNVPYADTDNVSVNGSTQTWSSYSSMTTNTYHNHSWFPLARNYFDATDNTATTYTGSGVSGLMANISKIDGFATLKESQTVKDSSNNNIVSSATATLAYDGVNLNTSSATTTDYTFGYADVHANGSSYGTTSYNPYAAAGSSTGGDPIDISWAVDGNGQPVSLSSIRFVRVYTGVMNVGAFGETSTEVTGIYDADDAGTGTPSAPSIEIGDYTLEELYDEELVDTASPANMGVVEVDADGLADFLVSSTATVEATGGTNMYINSTNGTSLANVSLTAGTVVRIIAQSGTASPYIVSLKLI